MAKDVAPWRPSPSWEPRMFRSTLAVAMLLMVMTRPAPADGTGEGPGVWHDVTLRLHGALPHTHPTLGHDLGLTLSRSTDGRWRREAMGHSAFFEDRVLGRRTESYYSWQDHEGEVVESAEIDGRIRLVLRVTVHSDPWVQGGEARYTLDLTREGEAIKGTFEGVYTKKVDPATLQAKRGVISHVNDGAEGDRPCRGEVVGSVGSEPWPRLLEGHRPLTPGEHPRLMFRRDEVPELRRRALTPEGRVIVARLEAMLAEGHKETLWDTYGYGLMYQLTGDARWAERCKANVRAAIEDKIDGERYGWYSRDGGYLRVGPSVAAAAAGYDLCYDAWDPEFRQWVARKIQDRLWPKLAFEYDLAESDGQLNPRSNHFMNWNGGAGVAILAILGDPGTDDAITTRAHRLFQHRLKRGLLDGFGDHGWFWEGTFCGRFPTNGGLLQYMQALRVAEGKDYVNPCSQARWLVAKWCFEVLRHGGKLDTHMRGMYARDFDRGGGSAGGDFAQGFGAMPEEFKPAVLWFYHHVVEPGDKTYDALGPKQAAYALVNWPLGMQERDPGETLGHLLHDDDAGFYVFRSGWKGEGDIVVSTWNNSVVMGMGLHAAIGAGLPILRSPTHVDRLPDNATSITVIDTSALDGSKAISALAVDFSGRSGAPAVIVSAQRTLGPASRPGQGDASAPPLPPFLRPKPGSDSMVRETSPPRKGATSSTAARLRTFHVTLANQGMSLFIVQPAGEEHLPRIIGEPGKSLLAIGRRTFNFDGERIVLGETEAATAP